MKSPANFAFQLVAGRGASARGTARPFYAMNRDISPERNRSDFGRGLTRKGIDDMSTDPTHEEKAVLLETALSALREYQSGLPLAKRKGVTGTKVAGILVKIERLADRVASR